MDEDEELCGHWGVAAISQAARDALRDVEKSSGARVALAAAIALFGTIARYVLENGGPSLARTTIAGAKSTLDDHVGSGPLS